MVRIVCPKCEKDLQPGESFDAHVEQAHPEPGHVVGFGHTLGL